MGFGCSNPGALPQAGDERRAFGANKNRASCLCEEMLVLGRGRIGMRAGSLPPVELRGNSGDNFFDADGFHAAEIDGAFAQETGTAFDLMPKNVVTKSQRPC